MGAKQCLRSFIFVCVFDEQLVDQRPDCIVFRDIKTDVLVGKPVRVGIQKKVEQRSVRGKRTEIFPVEEVLPNMQADHDDLIGAVNFQRVAAVWLADVTVALVQMEMVAVLGAQDVVAVLSYKVNEEEILLVKLFYVVVPAETENHNILIRAAQPLRDELGLSAGRRWSKVSGKIWKLGRQSVDGTADFSLIIWSNHTFLLPKKLKYTTKYINIRR